ncbi:DUF3152 domain-containing protein [Antrihabitans sp. YC2-6]|uniref:DUF3152 domain-containing protein n=1 Tax=Antrihabitans sp. YC2-6 TaxID=2799498 RepID=UPI0018F2CFC4|nr:DUF3152 domain-containing protein [Antrihabitans sp. YC2-6]MBJ8347263.1 DUF3152 domain-containing protein [Antrihabitans sp. YC2-6]
MTEHGGPRLRGSAPGGSRSYAPGSDPGYDLDLAHSAEADRRTRAGADRSHQPLRAVWDPTVRDESKIRQPRPERRTKKKSRVGRFVTAYGWRAYSIPLLLVVTVLVVGDALRSGSSPSTTPEQDLSSAAVGHDSHGELVIGGPPAGDGSFAVDIPTGALPAGGPFSPVGAGTWHVVPGASEQIGQGTEVSSTYTIEIEDGIDMSAFGGDESFARVVQTTLSDPRSWTADPKFAFRRIDQGEPDFRVSLTSQMTTRDACGYDIPLDTSCYNQGMGRVVVNEARWVRGAIAYQGDIGSYRQYQINHEVGHAIGFVEHQPCAVEGGLAPVMMQQSFGTANNDIARLDPEGVVPSDGKICRFNPWPFPRG